MTLITDPVTTETVELFPYEKPSDIKDHRTHIINPPRNIHIWRPGMSAQDVVDIARATGQEVIALCGYKWVPKMDPELFEACKPCVDTAAFLMSQAGE